MLIATANKVNERLLVSVSSKGRAIFRHDHVTSGEIREIFS